MLITRGKDPYKGALAFPGGFIQYNEDPELACLRELQEECGIIGKSVELVTVAGNPKRDPRKHVISMAYHIQLEDYSQEPRGKDEVSTAKWYDLSDVWVGREMAFDHKEIVKVFLEKHLPHYLN